MKTTKTIITIILFALIFARLLHAQQWTVIASPSPSSAGNLLHGVEAVSENEVWAVGLYDTVVLGQTLEKTLTERWNGASWNVIPSPSPGLLYNALSEVKAVSSNNIYAVGYSAGIPATPQILVLHWSGNTWNVESTPIITGGAELRGLCVISANNIWAVGDRDVGVPGPDLGTLVVHWNGSSWDIISSPNVGDKQNFLSDVAAVSSTDIWAVGYYHFLTGPYQTLILHWNGSVWSVVSSPNTGLESFLYSISVVSASDIWATGKYNNGSTYVPLFIHWNGTNWSIVSSPGGGLSTSSISNNNGWSVGRSIARWNGTDWVSVSAPIPSDGILYSLSVISPSSMWTVGTNPIGGISKTLVMRFGSVTGIANGNSNAPSNFVLMQNYPNPFNPSTKINFSLPKNSAVKLTVYDIEGKEVEVLVNQNLGAGVYETEWHPVNLSSGVYFYTLKTNDFTFTKKMIFVK
jgi:hypothetical protein